MGAAHTAAQFQASKPTKSENALASASGSIERGNFWRLANGKLRHAYVNVKHKSIRQQAWPQLKPVRCTVHMCNIGSTATESTL
jgi:hypothetical protein